ncbi:hypothetical protein Taro_051836 [Colocasia esculenta]|uniref:Uncharacterized protein n=1 Tax=Colocasia esculenta TaxID=4460 RepID=A0A843XGX2_COLES|nr:hypothetical protein [Colocasia esculenta]
MSPNFAHVLPLSGWLTFDSSHRSFFNLSTHFWKAFSSYVCRMSGGGCSSPVRLETQLDLVQIGSSSSSGAEREQKREGGLDCAEWGARWAERPSRLNEIHSWVGGCTRSTGRGEKFGTIVKDRELL